MSEGLTDKQRVFVEHYLTCWNATEAARRAGYAYPNVEGPRNLVKPSIVQFIQARLTELKMSADEVLTRLSEHARGSIGSFMRVNGDGELSGFDLSEDKPVHLVRKAAVTKRRFKDGETETTVTVELYDAQAALALIGKHHKLFTDRTELTGVDGKPIEVRTFDYTAAAATIAAGSGADRDESGED